MKVFYNALIVHIVFNLYVYLKGREVIPHKKKYRIPYTAIFIIELILYLTGYFLNVRLPEYLLKPILLLGTSWMIFIGFLAAFLLIYDAIKLLGRKIPSLARIRLNSRRRKRYYFWGSFFIVIAIMTQGSYRFWHPVVNEYDLYIDKKVEGLDSLRVVMVADLHAGYLINKPVIDMYIDRIMEQKGDIILLAGDIIDYDLDPLIKEGMDEEFRRLSAPYGVFASTGNHEYRLNYEEKIKWLEKDAGLNVLRDEYVKVEDKFYIVGREDDHAPVRKNLPEILEGIDRSLPVIVINHEPHYLAQESDEKVDVALYGHTHNGQIFPYNLVIGMLYEVGHGYKKKDDTHIYVTSGLGLSGPQYRIGTISEIVVLNLKFGNRR